MKYLKKLQSSALRLEHFNCKKLNPNTQITMNTKKLSIAGACALTLGLASAQAADIYSVRSSGAGTTNDPQRLQTWLFSPDTNNPIELDSANTYVLNNNHNWSIRNSLTVVGQLNIASGALQAGKNSNLTWTMSTIPF